MSQTICIGGHLHGKRVHIMSHPSETSDMLDEPRYSLRILSKGETDQPSEQRRFYVFDEISDGEATILAAHHWNDGAGAEEN
ncbi:hypothetical protein CSC67_10655 [Pusillimonas caeni]|uniref:hypothetical protein n=1 Tax=Pusillimonas caeni TaxID=1348472 RepID=UPI000E59D27E|nr:hypothetical protein [Pusillimonas caeni]TFL13708.1 hypothetical protein CSC67_10655 [Pusillimonas caeni]